MDRAAKLKPFDLNHWMMTDRKRAVRAKPYELKDAAQDCADLAAKAGWLAVEIRKIAKGKGAAA